MNTLKKLKDKVVAVFQMIWINIPLHWNSECRALISSLRKDEWEVYEFLRTGRHYQLCKGSLELYITIDNKTAFCWDIRGSSPYAFYPIQEWGLLAQKLIDYQCYRILKPYLKKSVSGSIRAALEDNSNE